MNVAQKRRYLEQIEYNRRIQTLLSQVDNAKSTHEKNLQEEEQSRKRIIAEKLRSKAKIWAKKDQARSAMGKGFS